MQDYLVSALSSAETPPWDQQLAGRIAAFAAARPGLDDDVAAMVRLRIIDSFAVGLAAINRGPVASARAMALAQPRAGGACLFGLPADRTFDCGWAGFANGVAVRELDYNDTFLAADFAHPSDCISPLLAVAQQTGQSGQALTTAIAVAYEVHVALVTAIDLHSYKKDHVAHLAPAVAAGIGAMLGLSAPVIYQAVNQAVHLSFATRQSRKGDISSWKAYAPAQAGKIAIEAIDRCMRGEGAPNPIYEGEDSIIPWMLAGRDAEYVVRLPTPGESPRGILETFPKAHSAEYQAQAIIDLAFEARASVDPARITKAVLHTSDHTHFVIGTGSGDPQKFDPKASRETLDHSIMYILAVALQDGDWDHVTSYTPERASRRETIDLWRKIETSLDDDWTRRYHADDPAERAYGGRLEITLDDGSSQSFEKAAADAHPNGAAPWGGQDYQRKFQRLAADLLGEQETSRVLDVASNLKGLDGGQLSALNPVAPAGAIQPDRPTGQGIFDHPAESS
ncbi:MAG: MmgE/PrpD family protein [Alphaproteobacteria bacterium]